MSQGIPKQDNRRQLLIEQIEKAIKAKEGKSIDKPIKIAPLMRKVGYSKEYAERSTQLVKRKTFQELLSERFNKDLVMEEQDKLVRKSFRVVALRMKTKEYTQKELEKKLEKIGGKFLWWGGTAFGVTSFYAAFEDAKWKYHGLDQVHKLLGNYAAEKIQLEDDRQFRDKSNEELQALIEIGKKESGK